MPDGAGGVRALEGPARRHPAARRLETRPGSGPISPDVIDLARNVRLWFAPEQVRQEGRTPDYRFSLANERTFLAWLRTALALIGGGFAVDQFLPDLRWAWRVGLALALLGRACCAPCVRSITGCAASVRCAAARTCRSHGSRRC